MYWVYYKIKFFIRRVFFSAANILLSPGVYTAASENRKLVVSGSDTCRNRSEKADVGPGLKCYVFSSVLPVITFISAGC